VADRSETKRKQATQPRLDFEDDDVTASEVAAYAYCAKAWHLERVLHRSAGTDAQRLRTEGAERHVEHGAQLNRLHRFGRRSFWLSVTLLVLAVVLLVVGLL
jgi:hypothetical protein